MNVLDEISKYIDDQVYVNDTDFDNDVVYSVNKIIPLTKDKVLQTIDLSSLDRQINNDTPWRTKDGEPITIADVVNDKTLDKDHYDTFSKVDMSKPILIAPNGEIMDGNHRVGRAMIDNIESLKGYVFDDWSELESAITDDDEGM